MRRARGSRFRHPALEPGPLFVFISSPSHRFSSQCPITDIESTPLAGTMEVRPNHASPQGAALMKRTTKYVALDVHQAMTVASVREENGRILARSIFPTQRACHPGVLPRDAGIDPRRVATTPRSTSLLSHAALPKRIGPRRQEQNVRPTRAARRGSRSQRPPLSPEHTRHLGPSPAPSPTRLSPAAIPPRTNSA